MIRRNIETIDRKRKARAVYATVTTRTGEAVRIGAMLDDAGMVHVHRVNGGMIGGWKLERFHGGRLTPTTLRDFFAPATH